MTPTRLAVATGLVFRLLSGAAQAQETGDSGDYGAPAQAPVATAEITDSAGGVTAAAPAGAPAQPPSGNKRYEYRTVELPGPCPVTPTEPNPRLVAYERRELPNGTWQRYGGGCTGNPDDPVAPTLDLGDVYNTAVTVRASVRPIRPTVNVQPDGGTLVNQAAIVHVDDPVPPPAASAVNPLSGRQVVVTFTGPIYDWDFGDRAPGSTRTGLTSHGSPYRRGSAVPDEGAGKPYISHTYRRAGGFTVTVTATYQASYTFTGNTDGPLALDPLVLQQSAPVTVRSAQSELVAS